MVILTKTANVRQTPTAGDYIAFRNRMGSGIGKFRATGKNEIRLLALHGFVRDGEEFMAGCLGQALKEGGVGAFFRCKKEILAAIGNEKNPDVRVIGSFMVGNAEETVLSGPEFGRDTLIHAAKLRDAKAWQG